jgi:hypothetical protein
MLFVFLTSVLVYSSDCPQTHNPFASAFGMLAFERVTLCPAIVFLFKHCLSDDTELTVDLYVTKSTCRVFFLFYDNVF